MKNFLLPGYCLACPPVRNRKTLPANMKNYQQVGRVQHVLKEYPNDTFHFDSYAARQIERNLGIKGNMPAEPGTSGRGAWNAENDVIYFGTHRDTDIDHNYTLNFEGTKAWFKNETSNGSSDEKAIAKLEFFESGIFGLAGLELERRNQ